ncbi:MAG: 50S ribosomal protein L11 methyltransferase [Clostridiales bacterium]|nr:50S ribosomal protein L11 methyltransferase [Clostridiales bacterium]
MKWKKYTIETTTAAEDFISSMLSDLGIEGVEIEDKIPLTREDTAKMFIDILPELPPDDGVSYMSFYLEDGEDHTEMIARVREALKELRSFVNVGSGEITESETEDIDWINNWKEFFHAFTIEADPDASADGTPCRDLLIKPTWEALAAGDEDKLLIEVDPGISFGTGKHETTQLCIRQLMRYLRPGDEVLDLGCGSGILSIVSLKLGAAHVVGTDIDEDCLTSTYANFEVNHLGREQGDFYVGNLINDTILQERVGTERYDIVVANILADVIIPMAPVIPARLKKGGVFIASGIIDFKENDVVAAIEAAGLEVIAVSRQGEWVGITAVKR